MNVTHSSRQPSRHTIFAISPAFRAFDAHDLRRGLPVPNRERNLTGISRLRRARSPQRVARAKSRTQSHLPFAPSTRTISAEGCPRHLQNAISPAFCAFDAHDLRRGLRATNPKRILTCFRAFDARDLRRGLRATNLKRILTCFRAFGAHDLRRGLTFVMLRRRPPP